MTAWDAGYECLTSTLGDPSARPNSDDALGEGCGQLRLYSASRALHHENALDPEHADCRTAHREAARLITRAGDSEWAVEEAASAIASIEAFLAGQAMRP